MTNFRIGLCDPMQKDPLGRCFRVLAPDFTQSRCFPEAWDILPAAVLLGLLRLETVDLRHIALVAFDEQALQRTEAFVIVYPCLQCHIGSRCKRALGAVWFAPREGSGCVKN